ncbi:uncharacterized protein LOC136079650 isoform X2 [Hydra vulgaris]|uniref:Uncharacterized protein LOC136079650 isoform X2 n=1 Tax=Hydra vulgaris TaxID=6087 RepID=A0ABM4BRT8_HYDVU
MSYRKSYSTRRTKEFQSDPVDVAARYCIAQEDQDGFLLHEIDSIIGKGVFTKQKFKKNSFLLQYMGDLVSAEEGKKREIAYAHSMKGCFVFYFEHQFEKENFKRELSIDATLDHHLARYVNDSKKYPNSKMIKIIVGGKPFLCLFALCDIESGTELRYDYQDDKSVWWRKQVAYQKPFILSDILSKNFISTSIITSKEASEIFTSETLSENELSFIPISSEDVEKLNDEDIYFTIEKCEDVKLNKETQMVVPLAYYEIDSALSNCISSGKEILVQEDEKTQISPKIVHLSKKFEINEVYVKQQSF